MNDELHTDDRHAPPIVHLGDPGMYDEYTTGKPRPRWTTKLERKQRDKLNRIANLIPGNNRIWKLDDVVRMLSIDLWEAEENGAHADAVTELETLVLFVKRLEWDLGELHTEVRGATNRRGGRYDQIRPERP